MFSKIIDMTGKKIGRLTVIDRGPNVQSGNQKKPRWNCVCECGNTVLAAGTDLRKGTTKSCGCYRRDFHSKRLKKITGETHPAWKGGKYTRNGYTILRGHDIEVASGDFEIAEHRFIMEQHLGRKLTKDETVHHKNGIKSDNRIENLELWCGPQPTGCRVSDQVEWAKQILEKYDVKN